MSHERARLTVLLLFAVATVVGLLALIVAYAGKREVMAAIGWGAGAFGFVLTAGPPVIGLWRSRT